MPRRGQPAASTVAGTIRALIRGGPDRVQQELSRLRYYWPALLAEVVSRSSSLPHPHRHQLVLWLIEELLAVGVNDADFLLRGR